MGVGVAVGFMVGVGVAVAVTVAVGSAVRVAVSAGDAQAVSKRAANTSRMSLCVNMVITSLLGQMAGGTRKADVGLRFERTLTPTVLRKPQPSRWESLHKRPIPTDGDHRSQ